MHGIGAVDDNYPARFAALYMAAELQSVGIIHIETVLVDESVDFERQASHTFESSSGSVVVAGDGEFSPYGVVNFVEGTACIDYGYHRPYLV